MGQGVFIRYFEVEPLKVPRYTPYSKMAENTLFFSLHFNCPLLPRFKPNTPLNSADEIEATRNKVDCFVGMDTSYFYC